MTIKKYIFNLISADLKELHRVLPNYETFELREKQNPNFWSKKVNATKNKIELAKKALDKFGGLLE